MMIIYVEKFEQIGKTNKQKLLELISNYSKVAGFKVNMQKSITFLYTSHKQVEFEIKNSSIYIITQKMKYFGKFIKGNRYKTYVRKL